MPGVGRLASDHKVCVVNTLGFTALLVVFLWFSSGIVRHAFTPNPPQTCVLTHSCFLSLQFSNWTKQENIIPWRGLTPCSRWSPRDDAPGLRFLVIGGLSHSAPSIMTPFCVIMSMYRHSDLWLLYIWAPLNCFSAPIIPVPKKTHSWGKRCRFRKIHLRLSHSFPRSVFFFFSRQVRPHLHTCDKWSDTME